MNMGRRLFLYGALGAIGGLLTYLLSLPLFPHKTLTELIGPISDNPNDLTKLVSKLQSLPPLTTLGTPYGNLAYFLLGAFVSSFLVFAIRFERKGLMSALGYSILAFLVGGALTRGADALSDTILVSFPAIRMIGHLPWGFLVGSAISFVVWIFQGPTLPRFKRAAIAAGTAGVVSYALRILIAPAIAITTTMTMLKGDLSDPNRLMDMDLWASAKPDFFANYVIMSAAIGLCFAYVEARYRRASIRWEAGRNEGKEWELAVQPMLVGTSERSYIRLPAAAGVGSEHAVIGVQGVTYVVQPQPGFSILVNGYLAPAAYLRHGDVVQVGPHALRFLEANMPRPRDVPIIAAVQPVQAAPETQRPSLRATITDPAGRMNALRIGITTIGRDAGCDICVANPNASRRHAEVTFDGHLAMLSDLNSTNGTFVNGDRVVRKQLSSGDTIEIGGQTLKFLVHD